MPPTLLGWPTTEADGDIAAEAEPACQHSVMLPCNGGQQRGQSDKMVSDMGVWMKQRCVIEFLHVEKNCTH